MAIPENNFCEFFVNKPVEKPKNIKNAIKPQS